MLAGKEFNQLEKTLNFEDNIFIVMMLHLRVFLHIPIDQVFSNNFACKNTQAETLKWKIQVAKMEITNFAISTWLNAGKMFIIHTNW